MGQIKKSSMQRIYLVVFAFITIFSVGCQSLTPKRSLADIPPAKPLNRHNQETSNTDQPPVPVNPQYASDLWQRIRWNLRLLTYQHPRIAFEVEHLQHSTSALSRLLRRSEPYLHYIVEQVEKNNLPGELALLPAVESGFRPFASSRNGAVGLWQFMPATGRMFGLKQHWWYDGRRDITASTQAALKYLAMLNKRFNGDWLHTLAAYNAGPGTVSRAIRKAKQKKLPYDYWSLDLPKETQNYVPRLIALAKIVSNPALYGLSLPQLDNKPYFTIVKSHQQIDLQVAAELANTSLKQIHEINPAFTQGVTYPTQAVKLLIPVEQHIAFKKGLSALPHHKYLRWRKHKIRRGETLIHLARRYRVSVNAIQQINNLKTSHIQTDKHLLIPLSQALMLTKN